MGSIVYSFENGALSYSFRQSFARRLAVTGIVRDLVSLHGYSTQSRKTNGFPPSEKPFDGQTLDRYGEDHHKVGD